MSSSNTDDLSSAPASWSRNSISSSLFWQIPLPEPYDRCYCEERGTNQGSLCQPDQAIEARTARRENQLLCTDGLVHQVCEGDDGRHWSWCSVEYRLARQEVRAEAVRGAGKHAVVIVQLQELLWVHLTNIVES